MNTPKSPITTLIVIGIIFVFAVYILIKRKKNLAALETGEAERGCPEGTAQRERLQGGLCPL